MEKLFPSNKVRFRHLYDETDKEEQILFYRCSLMVETYIKIYSDGICFIASSSEAET